MKWYVRDNVVRCHCGTVLHIDRKRYCCGIDWLARYAVLKLNQEKELQEKAQAEMKKKDELEARRKRFIGELNNGVVVSEKNDKESEVHLQKQGEAKFHEEKKKRRKRRTHLQADTRNAVLDRDGHKCVRCKSADKLQVHHIWHRKFGGGNDMANLETLCLRCHIKEHKNEPIAKVMQKSL